MFDIRSMLLAAVVINLVFGVALVQAARRHRDIAGPAWWATAALSGVVALAGLGLRGLIPDWLSVVAANAILVGSMTCLWMGIRAFLGLSTSLRIVAAFVATDAIVRSVLFYGWDLLPARQIATSALQVLLAILVTRDLLRRRPEGLGTEISALIGVSVADGLEQVAHIVLLVRHPFYGDYFAAGVVEGTHLFLTLLIVSARLLTLFILMGARLQQELERLATRDPLTDLPNRRAFEPEAQRELDRARRHGDGLAVLVIDLDHFKEVNDTRGHAAGDEVLRGFADVMRSELRAHDLPCRFGGEEFHVLLPGTGPMEANNVAERLREQLAAKTGVTASVGIAIHPAHGYELDPLLVLADRALYRAKRKGRDRVEMADPTSTSSPEAVPVVTPGVDIAPSE